MVNEQENAVLRKLQRLEKSVAPSAQKLGTLRLAVQNQCQAIPAPQK